MAADDQSWLDPDIEAMKLSAGEKTGLQVYRNYTRSFENHAISRFRETISEERFDVSDINKIHSSIISDDIRFLPVIVCGFSDDILKDVFKIVIPSAVPGGIAAMISGYGPLSDLSKRIKLAFAFDVLSADLMESLDHVRSVRNRIAHDWDVAKISDFHLTGRITELPPIETYLADRTHDYPELATPLDAEAAFRIRLIWMMGRLAYEAKAYHRAKEARLSPYRALYADGGTAWLGSISKVCLEATLSVVRGEGA